MVSNMHLELSGPDRIAYIHRDGHEPSRCICPDADKQHRPVLMREGPQGPSSAGVGQRMHFKWFARLLRVMLGLCCCKGACGMLLVSR